MQIKNDGYKKCPLNKQFYGSKIILAHTLHMVMDSYMSGISNNSVGNAPILRPAGFHSKEMHEDHFGIQKIAYLKDI